jgi:tetratricopeptide (TPR) repeat protein
VRAGAGRGPSDPSEPIRLLGPRREGPAEPTIPADVTGAELERPVRAQLRTLSKANAEVVARHLVMTARLLPEDPELAYAHAMAAQRRAGRVAVVREVVGVAAYHAGLWAEALSELRAARRMSGSSHQLPLMADAERGLGRPERALELAASPEAESLSEAERVEMAIVVSGARRDLGQADAAVLALQIPELTATATHAYTPRLRYAYAAALLEAGRRDEALVWFAQAADSDQDGETDAEEQLADLQGIVITDLAEDDDEVDDEDEDQRPDNSAPDDGADDSATDGPGGSAGDGDADIDGAGDSAGGADIDGACDASVSDASQQDDPAAPALPDDTANDLPDEGNDR